MGQIGRPPLYIIDIYNLDTGQSLRSHAGRHSFGGLLPTDCGAQGRDRGGGRGMRAGVRRRRGDNANAVGFWGDCGGALEKGV